jgi:hypothetical protein
VREFIDEGWNRDTEGRKAFDAVLTHTGIARRKIRSIRRRRWSR